MGTLAVNGYKYKLPIWNETKWWKDIDITYEMGFFLVSNSWPRFLLYTYGSLKNCLKWNDQP